MQSELWLSGGLDRRAVHRLDCEATHGSSRRLLSRRIHSAYDHGGRAHHRPLFAKLPESERKTLAAHAADVRLERDEWLVLEGQAPAFFAIPDGALTIDKNVGGADRELTSYEEGDFFGEVPLLLGSRAIASVRAKTPSRVMRIEPDDFHHMITQCAVLNGEIMRTMAFPRRPAPSGWWPKHQRPGRPWLEIQTTSPVTMCAIF